MDRGPWRELLRDLRRDAPAGELRQDVGSCLFATVVRGLDRQGELPVLLEALALPQTQVTVELGAVVELDLVAAAVAGLRELRRAFGLNRAGELTGAYVEVHGRAASRRGQWAGNPLAWSVTGSVTSECTATTSSSTHPVVRFMSVSAAFSDRD